MNLCLNVLAREVLVCHGRKEKNSESLDVYLIKFLSLVGICSLNWGRIGMALSFFPSAK